MKVSGAKQVHYDSGPNMTPLVDVVMVILMILGVVLTWALNVLEGRLAPWQEEGR